MIQKKRKRRLCVHNESLNEELAREIKYLRSVARDVIDRYSLMVSARLLGIVRILESSDKNRRKTRKPKDQTMREMLSCVRSIRVKPKKGRAKDLARIEAIVKKLDDFMPSQP